MLIFGFKVCPSSSNDYIKGYIITEPLDSTHTYCERWYIFKLCFSCGSDLKIERINNKK